MNGDGLAQLAQRHDELWLVKFRSLWGDLGQAPDSARSPPVRGDDLGSGRDLGELGLDAPAFARKLIELRAVAVEIPASASLVFVELRLRLFPVQERRGFCRFV